MKSFPTGLTLTRSLLCAALAAWTGVCYAQTKPASSTEYAEPAAESQWLVQLPTGGGIDGLSWINGSVTAAPYLQNAYIVTLDQAVTRQQAGSLFAGASGFEALTTSQPVSRFVPNDSSFSSQWHLNNTGQSGGTTGQDLNVIETWGTTGYNGYTGSGVVIGIADDGVQHTHPDLAPNYLASASYDFNGNDSDPSPSASDTHGTPVAGVAAARGNNATGVSGVAPEAQFAALRLTAGGISDSTVATALTYQNDVIDIYSNSWGPSDNGSTLGGAGPITRAALQDATTNGRGGLGNIYTWAGGNGGNGDNVNFDRYANSRHTIAVGAIDHDGVRSSYSEQGAPLFVVAPSSGDGVGITTTAISSGYTNSFGGTSSATPAVAGVIALMLEANPNLTYRDVQHILANTARHNDAGDIDWTTNGAGHLVNHKYGFGAVDAQAAVNAALGWTSVGEEVSVISDIASVNAALPDNGPAVLDTISVTEDIVIEWVEVDFTATHTYRGDFEIILTSPMGTESVLATPRGDSGDNWDWTFTSARHWDESSLGDWTLSVRDSLNLDTGTWDTWSLNFYGTVPEPGTLALLAMGVFLVTRRRAA